MLLDLDEDEEWLVESAESEPRWEELVLHLMSALRDADKLALRLKLSGDSDSQQAARLGVSRPTAIKQRLVAFDRLRAVWRSVASDLGPDLASRLAQDLLEAGAGGIAVSGTSNPPPWLVRAVDEHPGVLDQRSREEEPVEVRPGGICAVEPFDPSDPAGHRLGMTRHLFVVMDEAGDEGWLTGMLAGTETELATEVDAILDPERVGLGYDIVVHSRYRGPLWTVQVRRRVGAVDESVLSKLDELSYRDEPVGVSLRRGLPLQPEGIDPRYAALRTLSEELDDLTGHCRHHRGALSAGPVSNPTPSI